MSKWQQKPQPFLLLGSTSEGNAVTLTGSDFERHMVISGITGSGKSTFLAWIVISLLRLGIAFSLIDPHGDLCRLILHLLLNSDFFSSQRSFQKLWFVDFNRTDSTIAFNVLKQPHDSHRTANNVLEALHRAFPTVGTTAALDNTFLAATYVLAENRRPITDIQQLLLDASFRKSLLQNVSDPLVVQFFESKLAEKANSNLIDSTMRRSFLLTFSPQLRNTLSQVENKLNFSDLMNNGRSCLFSLGGLDDQSKRLLGCLLMVGLEQAFLSRATLSPNRRFPYHVIVDEFPLFSASGDSFSIILEQVRKYSGTLYLAHQTMSQLSKGIAGSLGNAIAITMKASVDDSSALVSRFYRPIEQTPDFFSFLLGTSSSSPFTSVKNTQDARMIFENLQRQEAIITLHGKAQKIITPTLPIGKIDHTQLTALEHAYARYLLTPLSQGNAPGLSSSKASAPLSSLAKRRMPLVSHQVTPFQTFVGATGTDEQLQAMFSLYGYLTVAMVAKLLGKSENTTRNKLNRLVDAGVLTTSNVPRTTTTGKNPTVFSLKKGTRRHEFLAHSLATSAILINAALLPTVAPQFTIVEIQADHTIKASPIKVTDRILIPDGIVRLASRDYDYAVYLEVDRNTEFQKEKITSKLNSYKSLASQCECIVVAFCVVEGGDLRVKTLKKWAAEVVPVELRQVFLFAPIDLDTLTPDTLFLAPIWSSLSSTSLTVLLEP